MDARDGRVAVRGWTETSTLTAADLAERARRPASRPLIYTDVARDGMLQGPDVSGALALQARVRAVIASGGVSSLDDLRGIADAGLAGAIVGRALYEGRFDLPQALEAAARGRGLGLMLAAALVVLLAAGLAALHLSRIERLGPKGVGAAWSPGRSPGRPSASCS